MFNRVQLCQKWYHFYALKAVSGQFIIQLRYLAVVNIFQNGDETMNLYISDTHFGHKNVTRPTALNAGACINNYTPASLNELIRNNAAFQKEGGS